MPSQKSSSPSWLILVFALAAHTAFSQPEMFEAAIEAYAEASNATLTHETIIIDWKMGGKIQADLNEGLNTLLENNPSLAETSFTSVIKQDSSIWQAYYYRAVCRKQLHNYKQAHQDILRVINSGHVLYESYLELGKIYQLQHNLKDAEKNFDKSIKLQPEKSAAYYARANLQLDQGEQKNAIKNYLTCLERDSLHENAHLRLALLQTGIRNRPEIGMLHYNAVLRHNPLNKHALLFRSLAEVNANPTQSIADLNVLVRVSPDNLIALFMRGLLLSETGDFARAFPDFHKVIELTSENDNKFVGRQTWMDKKIDIQNAGAYAVTRVYGLPDEDGTKIKKAYCLLVIGAHDKSIATINESTLASKEPLCLFLKGVASEHSGKHEEAYKYYERALKLDNDILDAHKKKGIYEQELKLWDKSIVDFTEALRINPETYVLYKMRGVSNFWASRYSQSISDYTRYLERDTTDKEAIGFRGFTYLKLKQPLQASLDLSKSGDGEHIPFKVVENSIDSILQKGDTTTAQMYLNTLTARVPYFTEGYVARMKLLVHKNDWKTIDREIDRAIRNSRQDAGKGPHSYLLTIRGMSSSRAKKYDEAIAKLDEAIKFDKQNSLAFFERGKILLSTGKTNKAITDLRKASSLGYKEAETVLREISN